MNTVRFLPIASGSKGNCAVLVSPHAVVLIDCGISAKRIFEAMRGHGLDPAAIDAVFITHTHGDHISGLPQIMKQLRPRVYCHERNANFLARHCATGVAGSANGAVGNFFSTFNGDQGFHHRDLDVLALPVSHDADPTVCFKVFTGSHTIGVLTDLGDVEDVHRKTFGECDLLLVEANHCPEMLAGGPYPEYLKARIRSGQGHLSNQQACEFVTGLAHMPKHLLLGHLSESNNSFVAVKRAFDRLETGQIPHTVLEQRVVGPLLELKL